MTSFIQDEKATAALIESIQVEAEKDEQEQELEIRLLRLKMSRLARHRRSELSEAEQELLTIDADAYQHIVHSK